MSVRPTPMAVPDIDYLAKDYASFRRLMLDRMAVLMPAWKERNPADIGVMLVEALAYSADQLSYQQDAVATEAYLRTARKRISLRRHARLMDYFISEGCNARTWVHLQVSADVIGVGPVRRFRLAPRSPPRSRASKLSSPTIRASMSEAEVIFETMEPVQSLYAAHNEIALLHLERRPLLSAEGRDPATLDGRYIRKAGCCSGLETS